VRSVIFVLLPLIPEARLRVRLAMVFSIAIPSHVSIAGSIDMEEATSGQNRVVLAAPLGLPVLNAERSRAGTNSCRFPHPPKQSIDLLEQLALAAVARLELRWRLVIAAEPMGAVTLSVVKRAQGDRVRIARLLTGT